MNRVCFLLCSLLLLSLFVDTTDARRRRRNRRVARPPPEPAPVFVPGRTCDMTPKGNCGPLSHTYCGVTNNFAACRAVFVRFCGAPVAVTDVDSCLRDRCQGNHACHGQPGSPGIRGQCGEQVCVKTTTAAPATPKPAPPPPPPPPHPTPAPKPTAAPLTCQLNPGSHMHCVRASMEACGVTNHYAACRTVYVKYCKTPEPVPDPDTCVNQRCAGQDRKKCVGQDGKSGIWGQCCTQVCPHHPKPAPEKPCQIKCRASALDACGVTDADDECRRRYMIGCVDEECHGRRRNARTVSPSVQRELKRREDARREREDFLKSESPCNVVCKMQAYKKCGVTTTYGACRQVYRRDCKRVQCKEPRCEQDCRVMAFSACGMGAQYDQCREDYRQLCRPVRCRRTICLRESLLECGDSDCRKEYVRTCLKRQSTKWSEHVKSLKKIPSAYKDDDF